MADFRRKDLPNGDALFRPVTDAAREYVRQYIRDFGYEAAIGMSIYAEGSRASDYVKNAENTLRECGFSVLPALTSR